MAAKKQKSCKYTDDELTQSVKPRIHKARYQVTTKQKRQQRGRRKKTNNTNTNNSNNNDSDSDDEYNSSDSLDNIEVDRVTTRAQLDALRVTGSKLETDNLVFKGNDNDCHSRSDVSSIPSIFDAINKAKNKTKIPVIIGEKIEEQMEYEDFIEVFKTIDAAKYTFCSETQSPECRLSMVQISYIFNYLKDSDCTLKIIPSNIGAGNDVSSDNDEEDVDTKMQELESPKKVSDEDEKMMKVTSYKNAEILLNFQNKLRSKTTDLIANTLRIIWSDKGSFMLIPFIIWFFQGPNGLIILLISDSNELLNGILKWMVQKPRPFWVIKTLNNISYKWEQCYSFPSGHSQFSAAYITAILLLFGKYIPFYGIIWLIIIPIFAGLSRVYLGVHGIECVIYGWIIGISFSCSMCLIWPSLFVWFESIDTFSSIIFTIFIGVILPYFILYLILKLFPGPSSITLEEWTQNAINNTYGQSNGAADIDHSHLKLRPRYLNKYDFEIWSFFGGTLGVVILTKSTSVHGFIHKSCNINKHLVNLIFIVLIGYSVLIILLFPLIFIIPSKLKKINKNKLAICCKIFGSFMTGLWVTFGCSMFANSVFGLSC